MEIPLAPDREACCAVERLHEPARPRGPAPDAGLDDHDVRPADARRPLRARDRRGQVRRAGRRGGPGLLRRRAARFPHALDDLWLGLGLDPASPERLARGGPPPPRPHLQPRSPPGRASSPRTSGDGWRRSGPRSPARWRPAGSAWLASPRSGGPTRPSSRSCASHANGSSPSGRGCATACGAMLLPAIANIPSCSIRGGGSATR